MADIWPHSAFEHVLQQPDEPLRPFRCVLLMPLHSPRFDHVAAFLKQIVSERTKAYLPAVQIGDTVIERLDWVNSAGAIQHQLWDRIASADLVFCDLTGQNANVMFEAGVCAARKQIEQVIFLRDEFYRFDQPFDIAPFRYVTYSMTSDGAPRFEEKLEHLLIDVLIGFPDRRGATPTIALPLEMDFSEHRDDERVVTPAFAHRRVRNGSLEFGSLWSFPHSWATIGKLRIANVALSFSARFAQLHPDKDRGYIGVGLRSQHFYAPVGHIVYLNRDGSIMMAQPDESQEGFHNVCLRGVTDLDPCADHLFEIVFDDSKLFIKIDDLTREFTTGEMPKVLGARDDPTTSISLMDGSQSGDIAESLVALRRTTRPRHAASHHTRTDTATHLNPHTLRTRHLGHAGGHSHHIASANRAIQRIPIAAAPNRRFKPSGRDFDPLGRSLRIRAQSVL